MIKSPKAGFAPAVALATSLIGTAASADEADCVQIVNTDKLAEYAVEAGPDNLNPASFAVLTADNLNIINNKISDVIDRETRQATRSLRGIFASIERHGLDSSRAQRDLARLAENHVFATVAASIADGSLETQSAAETAINAARDEYRAALRDRLIDQVVAIEGAAPLCFNAPAP